MSIKHQHHTEQCMAHADLDNSRLMIRFMLCNIMQIVLTLTGSNHCLLFNNHCDRFISYIQTQSKFPLNRNIMQTHNQDVVSAGLCITTV